jgi:hypothetical protein
LRIAVREKWRGAFKVTYHWPLFGTRQMARHHAIMGHEMGNAVNRRNMER